MTAEVLELLGIHNFRIIGCPSFYEQYRLSKGIKLKEAGADHSVLGIREGDIVQTKLLELAYDAGSNLIMQSMSDLPLTLIEGKDIGDRHIKTKFPGLKLSSSELKQYIMTHGNIFYTRRDWSHFLSDKSFSFGSRFHGNMMAFTNGIKALWIRHDTRTDEMIEAMQLPNISQKEIMNVETVGELIDRCVYDRRFEKNYIKMSENYIAFLEENGAEHTFSGQDKMN